MDASKTLREFDPTIRRGLLVAYFGEATSNIFDARHGTDYNTAIETQGVWGEGTPHMKGMGMLVGSFD